MPESNEMSINDPVPCGIYVYTYHAVDKRTGKLLKLFPDDSIFYYKGYSIEKIIVNNELTIGNTFTKVEQVKEFYFIDYSMQQFFKTASLDKFGSITKPEWFNLHKKLLGVQFYFQYYKDEKYLEKDTTVQNNMYKLVRFCAQQNQLKGTLMTFYLQPDPKAPIFNYNIESAFKSKIRMIRAVYPGDQGEVIISINYIKKTSDYYIISLINDIITRLNLKNH